MDCKTFDSVVNIINEIALKHKIFSEKYYKDNPSFNLKTLTITKIVDETSYDNHFFDAVSKYIYTLLLDDLSDSIQSDCQNIIIRNRVKYEDSAFNKIYHYRFNKTNSAIPLKKCLTDLNGFRLIINAEFEYDELLEKLLNAKTLNVKFSRSYVRRDGIYQAIHLNVMNNKNTYFPWEIQIWKSQDEYKNEESHKEHKAKRKYIDWTTSYLKRRYK